MAASYGSGIHSPPPIGRPVDRVFEDAQFTGEIHLNGRKLRDYPKLCSKYDLGDTILIEISRNRLIEVPHEVCEYLFAERINCYHNVIRSIPDAISQLQALTHLNLSRNQLSVLPTALCMLSSLEVLSASNNKLVSLPEEIGKLENLMDLDVSCNEISHLPLQIGDLSALRCLNLRKNFLVELPIEISRLQLYRLDFSSNRIEKIPTVFRKMETLEQFILDHNPLSSPPAYVCTKGRQHIMKFLQIEAIKEDRKRGVLMSNDSDMKRYVRKSLPPAQPSEEFRNLLTAPESKWKRHTVLSNDSGYSTADGSEKNGWQSGEELKRQKADYERRKKQAEQIRLKQEQLDQEREKEETRKAAIRLKEEQKLLIERQEEQQRQEEAQRQEELKRQEEERKRRVEEEERRRKVEEEEAARKREGELQRLQEAVRKEEEAEKELLRQKTIELQKRTESKLADKNKLTNKNAVSSQSFKEQRRLGSGTQYRRAMSDGLKKPGQPSPNSQQVDNLNFINRNGVSENSRQSSTSTTPSVSPSPSPRNSVSHLAKPISPSGSTSHLAKASSPAGSTSHLAKPSSTKSSVPRANGPTSTTGQNQAVRRTKITGDRSNTSSPVTARSTRATGASNLRSQTTALTQGQTNIRRSSNSSTTDDDSKPKKGPSTPTESSRIKSRLEDQKQRGTVPGSGLKKSGQESMDTNRRINTRPPTNSYGTARGRIGSNKTLEDSSSNFTIRRREEHQREEAEQMDRLRQTVETRLRVTLPDNLAEALRDGVVLCHLANQIRPRSVGSIHVPSPAVPKLTLAKCRRNVDNFLDACRKIGVDQEQICGPQDICDEKGISRVAITVAALVAIGTNPKQSAV